MPSGQTGPQPMTMPFGGGFNSPFGGFGGMPMFGPAQPYQQPAVLEQAPQAKNYGPVSGVLSSAQNQVNPQQPIGPINRPGTNSPDLSMIPNGNAPTGRPIGGGTNGVNTGMPQVGGGFQMPACGPMNPAACGPMPSMGMPSMGGVAPGVGRGKSRASGPGTSGGFSGGCGVTPRGMM